MGSVAVDLPVVAVVDPSPHRSDVTLPPVAVTGLTAQTIVSLPSVTVTNPGTLTANVTLPGVTVTAIGRRASVTLPRVIVRSPTPTYTTVPGQWHMGADGIWRAFIVVHLGADGQWRNLADGAVIPTVGP